MEKKKIRAEISARLADEFESFYREQFSQDAIVESMLRTYMALPPALQGRLITAKSGDVVRILRKNLFSPFHLLFFLSEREKPLMAHLVELWAKHEWQEKARSILKKIPKEMIQEMAAKADLSSSEKTLLNNYLQTLRRLFVVGQPNDMEKTS